MENGNKDVKKHVNEHDDLDGEHCGAVDWEDEIFGRHM
jgi:hypothetical protein